MDRMVEEIQGGYLTLPLANAEVAEVGKLAAIDTANGGIIVAGKAAEDLLFIGYFNESLVGNGTRKVHIRLFREFNGYWWDNDAVAPVALADRGKLVYVKDSQTVSISGTTRSALGIVLDVNAVDGVYVVPAFPNVAPVAVA